MRIKNNKAEDVRITYIGGGSRGWAWNLMSDLATEEKMGVVVTLYDIDMEAARNNVVIGTKLPKEGGRENFTYLACADLREALLARLAEKEYGVEKISRDEIMDPSILNLMNPHIYTQNAVIRACLTRFMEPAYQAFAQDLLVLLPIDEVRRLFEEMAEKTSAYLDYYGRGSSPSAP